ncbi:MAG TPA: NAD-dependent epimerase/dehydratase family protein [Actinomycetes bacterium]|nr:NAD-dependent epimerase/dehydratase family protein [Actinomycetes bacterium]
MSRTVLVTGVSRLPGTELARRLQAAPEVDRVIGVDLTSPADDLGPVEFVRADIRSPMIAKVVEATEIETVVHLGTLQPPSGPGRGASGREIALIGTMQLLAACQRAASVRRFILQSSTTVYGATAHDPALFTEDMTPASPPGGRSRDIFEMESYVRGFARRRPDVSTTILRLAHLAGPTADTALTRHLRLRVVPTVFGFDPRLQFLHVDDAVEVLVTAVLASRTAARTSPTRTVGSDLAGATTEAPPGGAPPAVVGAPVLSGTVRAGRTQPGRPIVYNVAGEGAVYLSQAIRRLGRLALPVPAPMLPYVRALVGKGGELPPISELTYGRVADTTRMQTDLGFRPRYSTAEALATMGGEHDG